MVHFLKQIDIISLYLIKGFIFFVFVLIQHKLVAFLCLSTCIVSTMYFDIARVLLNEIKPTLTWFFL